MLIVISPAKTLDYDSPSPTKRFTQPQFLDHSEVLIDVLADYSPARISKLMKLSPKLAELNRDRYQTWSRPFKRATPNKRSLLSKAMCTLDWM